MRDGLSGVAKRGLSYPPSSSSYVRAGGLKKAVTRRVRTAVGGWEGFAGMITQNVKAAQHTRKESSVVCLEVSALDSVTLKGRCRGAGIYPFVGHFRTRYSTAC